MNKEKELKFEEAMKRLEEIVALLEAGDRPLDDSLKLFEEGIRLVKETNRVLAQAQQKVEILTKDQDGKVTGSQPIPAKDDQEE